MHGAIGDGEFAWTELLPHLTDRFTCYLPSTRGRGLSGDHADHSLPRLQDDITAFVASIGEPVCLLGWSGSGPLVLGAAEQIDTVAAVAAWESAGSNEAFGADGMADLGRFGAAMEQVGVAANDGRLDDALRAFLVGICNDEEIAALEGTDFHQRWAGGVPEMLVFLQHVMSTEDPGPLAADALARVTAPALLLTGTETVLPTMFGNVARFVSDRVADAQAREVARRRALRSRGRAGGARRRAGHLLRVGYARARTTRHGLTTTNPRDVGCARHERHADLGRVARTGAVKGTYPG